MWSLHALPLALAIGALFSILLVTMIYNRDARHILADRRFRHDDAGRLRAENGIDTSAKAIGMVPAFLAAATVGTALAIGYAALPDHAFADVMADQQIVNLAGSEETPLIQYEAKVKGKGWTGPATGGATAGSKSAKKAKALTSIKAQLTRQPYDGKLQYRVRTKAGWQSWIDAGTAAQDAKSRDIEAVCMRFTGDMAENSHICYRVLTKKYGWSAWANDGEPVGSEGLKAPICAIQVNTGFRWSQYGSTAYRKHTLSRAKKLIGKISGKKAITVRHGQITDYERSELKSYLKGGHVTGFIAVNLNTGKSVAYRPDKKQFSASTIKAPYMAALCKYKAKGISKYRKTIKKVLQDSNNKAYAKLFKKYGVKYMKKIMKAGGAKKRSVTASGYADLSARDLVRMWAVIDDYLLTGTTNAPMLDACLLGGTGSHYKVGLMYPDSWSGGIYSIAGQNDGCLYAVLSTYKNNNDYVDIYALSSYLVSLVR